MENSNDSSKEIFPGIKAWPMDGLPEGSIYVIDFNEAKAFWEQPESLKRREGISGRDEGGQQVLTDPAPEIEPV